MSQPSSPLLVQSGFSEVDSAGKEHDADHEKENEKTEFAHAGSYGLAENLQTFGVARQFEYSEYSNQSHDSQDCQRHGVATAASGVFRVDQHSTECYVIRYNSDLRNYCSYDSGNDDDDVCGEENKKENDGDDGTVNIIEWTRTNHYRELKVQKTRTMHWRHLACLPST